MDASRLVTINAGLGRREDWWIRRCDRRLSLSLAINRPGGIDENVAVSLA